MNQGANCVGGTKIAAAGAAGLVIPLAAAILSLLLPSGHKTAKLLLCPPLCKVNIYSSGAEASDH